MGVNYNEFTKKQLKDVDKEFKKRLERCVPVAKEILKMVVEADLPMGEFSDKKGVMNDDIRNTYESFSAKVLAHMLQSNICYMDKNFIFQLILQPFDQTKEIVLNAVSKSFERTEEILFGKDLLDVNFDDIHKILLKNAEEKLQTKNAEEELQK